MSFKNVLTAIALIFCTCAAKAQTGKLVIALSKQALKAVDTLEIDADYTMGGTIVPPYTLQCVAGDETGQSQRILRAG